MSQQLAIEKIDKRYIIDRQGKPAVLYAGLLDAAHRTGLKSIRVRLVQAPGEQNGMTAISAAIVEMEDGRIHEEIGDANAQNVGRMVALHIIRMSATRAKARALRDALNIGGVAVEELGPDGDGEDNDTPAPRPAAAQESRQQQQRQAPALSVVPPNADVPGSCQPATAQQLDRLVKLQGALGRPKEAPDGLSFDEAAAQIVELVRIFNSQTKGAKK